MFGAWASLKLSKISYIIASDFKNYQKSPMHMLGKNTNIQDLVNFYTFFMILHFYLSKKKHTLMISLL